MSHRTLTVSVCQFDKIGRFFDSKKFRNSMHGTGDQNVGISNPVK